MREVKIQVYYTVQNLNLETLKKNKSKLKSKVLLFTKLILTFECFSFLIVVLFYIHHMNWTPRHWSRKAFMIYLKPDHQFVTTWEGVLNYRFSFRFDTHKTSQQKLLHINRKTNKNTGKHFFKESVYLRFTSTRLTADLRTLLRILGSRMVTFSLFDKYCLL